MAGESILFADDDVQIRKLVGTFLTRRGYRVRTVVDGPEALAAITEEMPHLLITDVNMPIINGFELTRRLRQDHRTAKLPILMLSAREQATDVLAGYNEGADDYIPKPVELAILAAKIESLLKRVAAAAPATGDRAGKIAVFVHAKGGVGTTALAVNTSIALTSTGMFKVGLLDLSVPFGNAAVLLDLREQRTLAGLAEMPLGETDEAGFNEYVHKHQSGVRVVAAPELPEQADLISVPVVQTVIGRLRAQLDYLVIDTPASLSEPMLAALDAADLVCVVTAPHLVALKATADYLAVLRKIGVPADRTLLLLNRPRQRGLENDAVRDFFDRKPDAIVPYSELFDEAADAGQPLFSTHPDNAAAAAVRQLAALIARKAPPSA